MTVFFLIYFMFYVVSPLSAAVPSVEHPDGTARQGSGETLSPVSADALYGDSPSVLERKDSQTDLFLFDMLLWEILKRGRPSVDSASETGYLLKEKNGLSHVIDLSYKVISALLSAAVVPLLLFPSRRPAAMTASLFLRRNVSRAFSGLSPPFLP